MVDRRRAVRDVDGRGRNVPEMLPLPDGDDKSAVYRPVTPIT
jgi:hypothetical protein